MRVDVSMPQMGESIAEGTITRWLKKVGDKVDRDEPIFEISTDKVDAEIPSPAAGVLVEVRNQEGDTVEVNSVVAVLETDADAADSGDAGDAGDAAASTTDSTDKPAETEPAKPEKPSKPAESAETQREQKPAAKAGGGEGAFVSPVVRRIAAEHDIDPTTVPGSGAGGRVTKKDILAFIEQGAPAAKADRATAPKADRATAPKAAKPSAGAGAGEKTRRETMSVMRRKIAEHMIESRRTSAHVNSIFEVDVTRLVRLRSRHNAAYVERHGTKLSYLAFMIKAVCDGLRNWPVLNASVEGDEIVYRHDLNIGLAVALDWGLIVPVVRNADDLSIAGLSKKVADLANRARNKQLSPDEVQGGTFTITNPGQFGGLYGLPIINQPQVAILGMGGIKKRPVVIDDAIAIRSMMYVSMSYDHRVVDGAVADQFLAEVQHTLENFDESLL